MVSRHLVLARLAPLFVAVFAVIVYQFAIRTVQPTADITAAVSLDLHEEPVSDTLEPS